MEGVRFAILHQWGMQGKTLKEGKRLDNSLVPLPWDAPIEQKRQSVNDMKSVLMGIANSYNKKKSKKGKRK